MHPRRRDIVIALESVEVGFQLSKQPSLLLLTHGRQFGDDDLRVLEFDQVMELNAGFLFARIVTVEDGIAAGLDLVGVCNLLRVGCGRTGLVVDDLLLLNQINDTNKSRKAVLK